MDAATLLLLMKIIPIPIILFGIFTYPKWSRKEWYKRLEINSKHPDWTPNCCINFLEKDPQWFINNGYGKYVQQ